MLGNGDIAELPLLAVLVGADDLRGLAVTSRVDPLAAVRILRRGFPLVLTVFHTGCSFALPAEKFMYHWDSLLMSSCANAQSFHSLD